MYTDFICLFLSFTVDKENLKDPVKFKKRKIRAKEEIGKDIIQEEAALRKKKLQDSIRQQEELHKIKIDAASQEKKYWEIKTELLLKENVSF